MSCFGVGFLLCLFTGDLFLCLTPFLWGMVSDPSAGLLLSACCDGLLIVSQFCSVVWLWVLLTGSRDELCGLPSALFQAVAYHQPAVSPPAFPAICLLIVHVEISSLPLLPLLCIQCSRPLCCVLVFSSLFIVQFCFFVCMCVGSVCPGGYTGLSQGWLGDTAWCFVLTCLVCQMSPKQVWSWRLMTDSGSPPVFSV
jgi:hypothetical protein